MAATSIQHGARLLVAAAQLTQSLGTVTQETGE